MATMYNKTALYRMKKDDLMKLFLDQQAEKNQLVLESEENKKLEMVFNPKTTCEYKALFRRLGISNDGLKGKKSYFVKYEEYKKSLPEYSKLKEENEELKESLRQTNKDTNKILRVVEQLKAKLDEAMVANARLVYANKTLSDASLNERQKSKIVEAIAKATSVDEAKVLHETLSATVGSSSKSGPQSLSESVNRRSNLSAIMPRRKEPVVTESMSFADRMKKLAGIN